MSTLLWRRHLDPPPLVKARLQEIEPFEVTGVDFTGAFGLAVRDSTN